MSTVNYLEIAENDESFQLLDSFIYPHQLSIPIVLEVRIIKNEILVYFLIIFVLHDFFFFFLGQNSRKIKRN